VVTDIEKYVTFVDVVFLFAEFKIRTCWFDGDNEIIMRIWRVKFDTETYHKHNCKLSVKHVL
jgi:hypothetical protein